MQARPQQQLTVVPHKLNDSYGGKTMTKTLKDHIKTVVEKQKLEVPELKKLDAESIITKIIEGHLTAKEAMGFSDSYLEMIYAYAYNLFQAGQYKKASEAYRVLIFLNAKEAKFYQALAACLHREKEYLEAASYYIAATVINKEDPMPFYHAHDCFLKSNNVPGAILMLKMMLKTIGDNKKYELFKKQAEETVTKLEKDLKAKKE